MEVQQVQLFKGGAFHDDRGKLSYINDFTFEGIKRFYQITHPDAAVVRAWQGHKIESKYFYVAHGTFAIAWVKINDWENPDCDLVAQVQMLKASDPCILMIPPGYANGIKAVEPGSVLMVYSNLSLQESSADRWSFDPRLWLDWSAF